MKKILTLLLLATLSFGGYIPEHIMFADWCREVTKEVVKTGNPIIDKSAQYITMMGSHVVCDIFIGEHKQGEYDSSLTIVNALTMFFATPEERRLEYLESATFGWLIPDVFLKKEFHSHGIAPIYNMTQDQSILFSNVMVMIYTVRVRFNLPFTDIEIDL